MNGNQFDPQVITEQEKKSYTHDQLHEALLFVQDTMERAQIPFFLLKTTADSMFDNESPTLSGDGIYIGVKSNHLTESGSSTLWSLLPGMNREKGRITFDHMGVPIEITIVHKKYPFFDRPDSRFYCLTQFPMPNPFSSYWEERNEIE